MPFCPNCKYEYKEGIEVCADCGLELVDELPDEIGEETQCDYCGNPVDAASEYCKFCGTLFVHGVKCQVHPDREAAARCLICQKPLCEHCISEKKGKSFCKDHDDYKFMESMAVVGITELEWDAELNKKMLIDHEIPAMIFTHRDSALAIGKQSQIYLMVPFEYALKAEELLEQYEEEYSEEEE